MPGENLCRTKLEGSEDDIIEGQPEQKKKNISNILHSNKVLFTSNMDWKKLGEI